MYTKKKLIKTRLNYDNLKVLKCKMAYNIYIVKFLIKIQLFETCR